MSNKKAILYYTDWCGHCKNFKPKWNKIKMSKILKNKGIDLTEINVGELPEEKQKEIREEIPGVPTIIVVSGDDRTVYLGPMEIDDVVEYIVEDEKKYVLKGGGNVDYEKKYLKYKKKYLELKKKLFVD